MPNKPFSLLTELAEPPAVDDFMAWTDKSDTTESVDGTSKRNKAQYALGSQVNAQTGTSYTYLTTDFRKLVTHTNGSAIAGTLPQASATFPAGWFMFVQNRGAGGLTITPTTSTIDGAATLVLNQNEGALIVSDGANYFSMRGKATGGVGGVGDVVGPGSATDNALARFDSTTGKLIQNSTVTLDDTGALTVPEMAAPSTPASGKVAVYAKSDGKLYIKDDTGTETDLTDAGGGGTPAGASGSVQYNDAGAFGGSNISVNPTAMFPATSGDIDLGITSNRWDQFWANDILASGTGAAGGRIRFFGSGGNAAEIASTVNRKSISFIDGITGNPGTISFKSHTPAQFGTNQNNYTEEGGNSHGFFRWSSDTSRDVTGLSISQEDGDVHIIVNRESNNIVLKHEDANSTAANRFLNSTGADITLSANQAADAIYDGTTQRWRVFKRN